ncbi:MAG: HNH endonuclease [Thermales bacterium]|nr:HNH endonuclease [Thermales bacterium]
MFLLEPEYNSESLDGIDEYNSKKICFSVNGLNEMSITQTFPLLFVLLSRRNELQKISNIIDVLVDFHVLYSKFSKSPAREIEKIYGKIARELNSASTKEDCDKIYNELVSNLKNLLDEYVVSKEVFVNTFKELKYGSKSSNSLIKYLFMRYYEDELEIKYGYNSITIEHIYPQSKNISKLFNMNTIGNLTLLYSQGNTKIGDRLPKDKWHLYKQYDRNGNIKLLLSEIEKESIQKIGLKMILIKELIV